MLHAMCSTLLSADTQYSQDRLSRLGITNVQFCRRPVGLLQVLFIGGYQAWGCCHLCLCFPPLGYIRW